MSASDSVALPAPLRRRAEIIGLGAGFLCFLFALFGNSLGALLPSGPSGVVLPMVLFSGFAGVVASVFRSPTADSLIGAAPRLGIRAGLFAAITGGALTVSAATLHAFGIGSFPQDNSSFAALSSLFPKAGAYLNLIAAVLGIPPAIFFGLAGAVITTMVCARIRSPEAATGAVPQPLIRFRDPVFSMMLALSAIGYLSPFTVALKPKPKPRPVVFAPVAPVIPIATPIPAPKWRYKKPAAFDSAEPDQVVFSTLRTFEIDTNLPVALSPDETRLAYFRRDGGTTLEVRELDSLDIVNAVHINGNPSVLAWSPDGSRLLLVNQAEAKTIQVAEIGSGRLFVLPQPINERIPDGQPNWWSENEVLFFKDEILHCLNLETLRVLPADESTAWNALGKQKQTTIAAYQNRPPLPGNFRWVLDIAPRINRYIAPSDLSGVWQTNEWLHLTFADPDNAYRSSIGAVELKLGDVVLATSDSSKFLRLRDGTATVFFFGLRDRPSTTLRTSMPSPPDPALTEALSGKTVCAFICEPTVNPLNGKTVGPNRERIRALVRIAKWKDNEAEAWITEEYMPVREGDVIADLHTWNNHRIQPIPGTGTKDWFSVINRLDRKATPPISDVQPLDRKFSVNVMRSNGTERIARIITASLPRKTATAPVQTPSTPPPSTPSPEPAFVGRPAPAFPVEQQLTAFITEHHAKSSRGDVTGLVDDYADHVDHFDHGIVDREFIRRDEVEYHSPGTRVTESITTAPVFTPLGNGLYSATYSLSFLRIRPDRHWTKGISEIQMQINLTPNGPRITSQRSQSHDLQKGRY